MIHLRCPDFDKEAAAFVRDLEHFGPREAVDPQLVLVNHQATRADAQRNVDTIKVLRSHTQKNRTITSYDIPVMIQAAVTVTSHWEADFLALPGCGF